MLAYLRVLAVLALVAVCASISAHAVIIAHPNAELAGVTDYRLSNNAENPYPASGTTGGTHGSLYTSATLTGGAFTIQGATEMYSSEVRPSASVQVTSMTLSGGNVVITGYFPHNTIIQFTQLSGTVTANTPLIGMTGLTSAENVVVQVSDSTVEWAADETSANTQVLFWIPATTTSSSAVFALGVDVTRASSIVSTSTTPSSASMVVSANAVVAADYIRCSGCANGIIYVSSAPMFVQSGGLIRASHITITSAATVPILNTDGSAISSVGTGLLVVENVVTSAANIFGGAVSSGVAGGVVLRNVHVAAVGTTVGSQVLYSGVTTQAADGAMDGATEVTSGCPVACLNSGYLALPLESCDCTCPGSASSSSATDGQFYKNFCTTMNDPLASYVPTDCTAGCSVCHNETACTTCSDGFTLNKVTAKCDQTPAVCPSNCKTCSAAGLCIDCNDGYAASTSGACVRCAVTNCQTCSASSPTVCATCIGGAAPVNNICVATCTDVNCISCPTAPGTCTRCAEHYGLVNGVCTACADPQCTQCNVDVNICTACEGGYPVTDSGCSSSSGSCDVTDCVTCSAADPTKCETCIDGMVADTVTGQCITSGDCSVANCVTCSATSAHLCDTCADGYLRSADHTSCTATTTSTTTTTTSTTTTTTEAPSSTTTTTTDPNGGTTTTSAPTCTALNCAMCESGSTTTCKYCNANYYVSNGQCVLTGSCHVGNCAQCMLRDSTKCSNCVSGYLISSTFTCLSQHVNVNAAAAPHSLWVAAAVLVVSAVTYLV